MHDCAIGQLSTELGDSKCSVASMWPGFGDVRTASLSTLRATGRQGSVTSVGVELPDCRHHSPAQPGGGDRDRDRDEKKRGAMKGATQHAAGHMRFGCTRSVLLWRVFEAEAAARSREATMQAWAGRRI